MSQVKLILVVQPKKQKILLEVDCDVIISEIFEFVKEDLSGNTSGWTCFSQEKGLYLKNDFMLGSSQNQTLFINTQDNANVMLPYHGFSHNRSINTQQKNNSSLQMITVSLLVQPNNLSLQIKLDYITTIQKIFDDLKEELSLSGNTSDWTCFSEEKQRFLVANEELGNQLQSQTLRINTSDNAKLALISNQQYRVQVPIQQEMQFCQQHIQCPIQFICTEKHNCQRRLCGECQQDQIHNQLSISQFVPLEQFKGKIRAQAQQSLNQKNNYKHLQKKMKNIILKIQEVIQSQEKQIVNEIQKYNDSFSNATDILNTLDKYQILDNSNTILEELVLIYQQNLLQKQGIINNINLKTIEENINKFDSIVDSFSEQIKKLEFDVIPLVECKVDLESTDVQIIHEGINIITPQNQCYGKYLISQSNLKIEIYDSFLFIKSFPFNLSTLTTLRDIGNFVKQQCNNLSQLKNIMTDDIEQWIYFSESKNRKLQDFDLKLYHFVFQDLIKINVATTNICLQKNNNEKINLKINIQDENQSKVLTNSFSQKCTIFDLEEQVLEFCQISNNQASVEIRICGKLYANYFKKTKTLFQLQIQNGTQIHATIKRANQKNKENQITLVFQIQDGGNNLKFQQSFSVNQAFSDVRRAIYDYCDIGDQLDCTIDMKIFGQSYNNEHQLKRNLDQLGLQNFSTVEGYVIWK